MNARRAMTWTFWIVVVGVIAMCALPASRSNAPESSSREPVGASAPTLPASVPVTGAAQVPEGARPADRHRGDRAYWVPRPVRGGSGTVDRGLATLFYGPLPTTSSSGTSWIVGRGDTGWHYWSELSPGAKVFVEGAHGRPVAYRVVDRTVLDRSESSPGLVRHDLMLQVDRGVGSVIVYADRIR